MKCLAVTILAITLASCSQQEADHTREQAREAGARLRVESKEALRQAEAGARKASRELDSGLNKAREKTRRALDVPDDSAHH